MHSVVGRASRLSLDAPDETHSLVLEAPCLLNPISLQKSFTSDDLDRMSEMLFTSREISVFSGEEEIAQVSSESANNFDAEKPTHSEPDITEMVRKLLESQKECEDANDRFWFKQARIMNNL